MREDDPATEIANSLCECLSACAMLCLQRRNEKTGQVEVILPGGRILITPEAGRDAILDAVSWFVEAAPLMDLPNVRAFGDTSEGEVREAAVVADRVKQAVLAWQGEVDPPPSLVSVARELLVTLRMEGLLTAAEHWVNE